jgi:hypothetical protein
MCLNISTLLAKMGRDKNKRKLYKKEMPIINTQLRVESVEYADDILVYYLIS